ncbi:MAG: hypothetical protein CMB72_00470 [Euryarchaeota archaeon]|nr:hypothetical protein [Euryarchaeota archaeon]
MAWWNSVDEGLQRVGSLSGLSIRQPLVRLAVTELVLLTFIIPAMILPESLDFIGLICAISSSIIVLSIHRVWSADERRRREIANRMMDGDPDLGNDLRIDVLIASLHLLLIVPLLLQRTDDVFDIYSVENEKFSVWFMFGMDLFSRSLLDWAEVYEIRFSDVNSSSMAGKHLVLFLLISIDILLIQSIIRLIGIRRTIREGVNAAARDPETAARIGKRVNKALLNSILDSDIVEDRRNRIRALAITGGPNEVESLWRLLSDESVRTETLATLIRIGKIEQTHRLLSSSNVSLRASALQWLILAPDGPHYYKIRQLENDPIPSIRISVLESLEDAPLEIASLSIIRLLNDQNDDVRIEASRQLRRLSPANILEHAPLLLNSESIPCRIHGVEALATVEDGRVVPHIVKMFDDEDERVRTAAQQAIEHLQRLAKLIDTDW